MPSKLPEEIPYTRASFDGPLGADPDDGDGEGSFDPRRLIAAVWRQRFLVAGFTLAGFAGGFALSRVVKPTYEAQATIQVPAAPRGFGVQNPLRSTPLFDAAGWVELVKSYQVLDAVVRERRLFLVPMGIADAPYIEGIQLAEDFAPGLYSVTSVESGRLRLMSGAGEVLEEAAVGDSLGLSRGLRWVPSPLLPGRSVQFQVLGLRDAAVRLGNDLVTRLPPDGALMRITLRGPDSRGTAATVNAVAAQFVVVANSLKTDRLNTVTGVLSAQLDRARSELAAAEEALERFKINTITLPNDRGSAIAPGLAETRDPVKDAFFRLREERGELVRDRDALVRALAESSAASDSSQALLISLGTITSARQNAELTSSVTLLVSKRADLRQMRVAFSSAHPPLRALEREIAELEGVVIPQQVRAVIGNLNQRIGDLDQRIASSSRELQQIPARQTEENRLERDVDIRRNTFTELQAAYEQARLAELSSAPDVRLLDTAVPPNQPLQNQVFILIAGAGMLGFGLGLGLALVLDRFDKRLRYPDQVTRELGLPILGALPLLKTRRDGSPDPEDAEHIIEAMRSVRLGLLLAHGTAGPFATTVTSPGSGDGKSFVSVRLARSLAQSGRKTLLIDGDNRRGYLHRTLKGTRTPGLMEVLQGEAKRSEAVQHLDAEGFDFISCGAHRRAAPELLSSAEMTKLMMDLRGEYQAIVIDSPPLGAGVDPLVLGSLCGSMVLVFRNGVTDRQLAESKLQDLERLPIRILGAILNDVAATGVYRYYSYLPGYRTADEGERGDEEPKVKGGVKKLLGQR